MSEGKLIPVDFDPFGSDLVFAPTTEAQREIWASIAIGGHVANCSYIESVSLHFNGDLNLEAFSAAAQAVVNRHDALRATISEDGLTMTVHPAMPARVAYADLTGEADIAAALQRRASQEMDTAFNLGTGPLFRFTVLRTGLSEYRAILSFHHIFCDGWSINIIMQDLGNAYSSIVTRQPVALEPGLSYAEYAVQETAWYQSAEYKITEKFWLSQFETPVPPLEWPVDKQRPAQRSFHANRVDRPLPREVIDGFRKLCASSRTSLVQALHNAYEVFLYRLTGQADLVTGMPVSGQNATGQLSQVGHCVYFLPLRSRIDPAETFSNYLNRQRNRFMDALEHQRFTFGSLVSKLKLNRSDSRIPLLSAAFNVDMGMTEGVAFRGLTFRFSTNVRLYDNFEMTFNLAGDAADLAIECTYNSDLFEDSSVSSYLAVFETLLTSIVHDPGEAIWRLNLIPERMARDILLNWNDTSLSFPESACVHDLFEQQAERHPGQTALTWNGQDLSYEELNRQANRLAHHLRFLGVDAEHTVGICVERSPEMVVAMLAILKAGGAYLPLDPIYPPDRLRFMIEDTKTRIVVSKERVAGCLDGFDGHVILLDAESKVIANEEYANPAPFSSASNKAYIIYTSGSTGKPKGVGITHQNLVALTAWARSVYSEEEIRGVLAISSLNFDASVFEIFHPLTSGGRVILLENALAIPRLTPGAGATMVLMVPSAMRELLRMKNGLPSSLITVNLGAEYVPQALVDEVLEATSIKNVYDLYGPTECTVISVFGKRVAHGVPRIGKPITNCRVYVLDAQMQPVPVGVHGELYIGGAGVAPGYINRPALTSERFVKDRFSKSPGAHLYRTGDRVRWLPDGSLQYIGRVDNQVKLRGYRIEPGEIESALENHPLVKKAVVESSGGLNEEKLLCAWIEATSTDAGISNTLKDALKETLPGYMVPAHITVLESIPLLPNGKVNRAALPTDEISGTRPGSSELLMQLSVSEEKLMDVWKEVLQLDKLTIHDNFFDLGGHSLLGARMLAVVQERFGVSLPLQALFRASTIEELALEIDGQKSSIAWTPLITITKGKGLPPLFCIHMHNGNVFRWNFLKKHLPPEQPVYAIQPRGLDESKQADRTIEEMAAGYIRIMKEVQPKGPYFLTGLCFGGMVVFEMACQLQAAGERTAMAAMINNYAPLPNKTYYRMQKEFKAFLKLDLQEKFNYAVQKNIGLGRRIRDKTMNLLYRASGQEYKPVVPEKVNIRFIHSMALLNYAPTEIYQGDIFIVRGGDVEDPGFYDESLGWKRLVSGKIEVAIVDGSDNDSIVEEERYNSRLASLIRNKMDSLRGETN